MTSSTPEMSGALQDRAAGSATRISIRTLSSVAGDRSCGMDSRARRERLSTIGDELNLLTAYRIEAGSAFAYLRDCDEPVLVLGEAIGLVLTIEIDAGSGLFILYDESGHNSCTIATASIERLIDQVISIASTAAGELTPRTMDAAIDVLVGRAIDEVERRLILRTILYFDCDISRSAFALGLTKDSLGEKLHAYLSARSTQETTLEDAQ